YRRRSARQGVQSIEPGEGMAVIEAVLAGRLPQIVPFKAETQLLEKMGIPSHRYLEVFPETIRPLDEVKTGDPREPVLPPASAADPEDGIDRLNRAARCLLLKSFLDMEVIQTGRIPVLPIRKRLLEALLDILKDAGWIEIEDGSVSGTPALDEPGLAAEMDASESEKARLAEAFPWLLPHAELLWTCAAHYPAILTGRVPATEVIFPGGSQHLVAGIYRDNPAADLLNGILAENVASYIESRLAESGRETGGRLRIIEIGAGTGGTTVPVLEAIRDHGERLRYTFTDIGEGFVRRGKKAFRKFDFMEFGTLDIEQEVTGQGYEAGAYDLAIAANVLHAAKNVGQALRHVKLLLKTNGLLVLNETIRKSDFSTLTFGLLDGWWRYEDEADRLPGSPLLDRWLWERILRQEGFQPVAGTSPPEGSRQYQTQEIILARSDGIVQRELPAGRDRSSQTEEASHGAGREAAAPQGEGGPAGSKEGGGRNRSSSASTRDAITGILAGVLDMEPSEFTLDAAFTEFGIDSIIAVEIVHRVNERFRLRLRTTDLFNFPTVRRLADHVREAAGPEFEATGHPAEISSVRPSEGDIRDERTEKSSHFTESIGRGPADPAEIAVIGMAGRFPGAADVAGFWRNLCEGRDSVDTVSEERWETEEHVGARGGFLADIDKFDPLFFNISPKEAELMDPQQRLFLQESWKALEDAGYSPSSLDGKKCGVFAGYNLIDYAQPLAERGLFQQAYAFTGNAAPILPARMSYLLNWKGPSIAINSACSSSLVAVHLACESLRSGTSELALAGGAQIMATGQFHMLADSIGMLSPGGRCRTFDHRADGFVPGEAVAVVVLKPLSRALRDRDHIYGVIKGSEINQDGKTNGITAPSAPSQTELEAGLYERIGLNPETIGYVETHGTGTELGDPIEIQALTDAFRRFTNRARFCAVGAVKTNIGHTLAAAGVASLVKVLLCLTHRKLVPSLHFEKPNPHIDFDNSPFYVSTECKDWTPQPAAPRRAAVSAFGFSGTNAHVVVEEFKDDDARRDSEARVGSEPQLIVLSAKNEDRLKAYAVSWLKYLESENRKIKIENIAYTLQVGREAMEERLALIAQSTEEIRAKLERFVGGKGPSGEWYRGNARTDGGRSAAILEGDAGEAFLQVVFRKRDLQKIARLWTTGIDIDWDLLYPEPHPSRISLPAYPFAMDRYW
ncbi:MAG: methyltransferase, partial [Desulfobacteraceae bacterium]|nr:methyltransferase [Desulfobacteraceae bacterium]